MAGPPDFIYGMLFVLALAIGQWSISRYGTVVVWVANGVLLAGLLQLPRKAAIRLLVFAVVVNLISNWLRHDRPVMLVLNVALNFGEVLLAGLIARRVCGAALDLRRPARLIRFFGLAVVPAVLLSASIGTPVAHPPAHEGWWDYEFWLTIETLGIMMTTPSLILLARRHRFAGDGANSSPWATAEKLGLMTLLAAVTVLAFSQTRAPLLFLVFLPLLLIAFRLSPNWSAGAILLVAATSTALSLSGYGPFTESRLGPSVWHDPGLLPMLRTLPIMHIFLGSVIAVALPASTVLTERRRLEARLRARTDAAVRARLLAEQAVGAKSRFLSLMSHEMRTPLNGVSGFAELLAARPDLDPEATRQVAAIRQSSGRLITLVDEILDFSRGEVEITQAPLCLPTLLAEAADAARPDADAKGLTITVSSAVGPAARHLGDARRIGQVLRALAGNAVKFTRVGGVSLALAEAAPGRMRIEVRDSGPGIAPTLLAGLFEPFAQGDASTSRSHEGAGMGLALARRLAELMGGALDGANHPEGGAVFSLELPLEEVEADPAPASQPAAPTEGRAPRILVVDDHPTNREVAKLMLVAIGCEVEMACDGREAVAAAEGGAFDLVLMDVRMPNMDGLDATRAIRRLPGPMAAAPIVAMTADAMPEDVSRCLAAGMNAHLAKPVSMADLCGALERFLGEEPAETAAA